MSFQILLYWCRNCIVVVLFHLNSSAVYLGPVCAGTVPHPRCAAVSAKMPVVSEDGAALLHSKGHVSWLLDPSFCFSSEALLCQLFSASYLIFLLCFPYFSLGVYSILPIPQKTYFYR